MSPLTENVYHYHMPMTSSIKGSNQINILYVTSQHVQMKVYQMLSDLGASTHAMPAA